MILAINPGATSTKIAVYDNDREVLKKSIEHTVSELQQYSHVTDQFDFRLKLVEDVLVKGAFKLKSIKAVVGRGGVNLRPIPSGTYIVDEVMLADLSDPNRGEHASNLGGILAYQIARKLGVAAYVVDPVTVDEMVDEARISGLPELPRISTCHTLNTKAVARKAAIQVGKSYDELNLVVAHLGTGISVSAHKEGKMIDVNGAQNEGPFSPDRCGGLPALELVKFCYKGNHSEAEMIKKIMGSGGMFAYLGTKDVREAEKLADNGNKEADLVLKAMVHQISKEIGAMSTVLKGYVNQIIITGGIAFSDRIVKGVIDNVRYIAPVTVIPGEEEMEALVSGARRVMLGDEPLKTYKNYVEGQ